MGKYLLRKATISKTRNCQTLDIVIPPLQINFLQLISDASPFDTSELVSTQDLIRWTYEIALGMEFLESRKVSNALKCLLSTNCFFLIQHKN